MKKFLSTILTLAFVQVFAQDAMTVKSKITTEGLPAEYAAMGEMEFVAYISGDNFRYDMSSMMTTNIFIQKGNNVISLTEAMGQKMGYKTTVAEMEKSKKDLQKPKIEYTTDKKMIAGYECTKVLITVTGKDGKPTVMVYWVTEAIKVDTKKFKSEQQDMDLSELKGYPLGMEMTQSANGMELKIIMTTTEVIMGPVGEDVFNVSTDGYNLMSLTEFRAMSKNKGH